MRSSLIVLFTLILINIPVSLFSQELNLVWESGLGSYNMNSLKAINNLNLQTLPFEAKITSNFPSYWNNKLSLQYCRKNIVLGIACSYQSTGSRISRIDYSGKYSFDTSIRSFSPGALIEYCFPVYKFRFSLSNEFGIENSKLGLDELIRINTESDENEYFYKSINYYDEPSIKISYPVLFFRLGLTIGYSFDLKKGVLHGSGANNKDTKLTLSGSGEARSDWSGMRLGASISFNLFQKQKCTIQLKNSSQN